jgi:GTP-binding protein YchF
VVPTQIELVDIAGLVKGASKGEGKGNAFLSHIKSVDAILHVVRCFQDPDVVHVDGRVDPVRDIEVIDLELVLKDLETVAAKLNRIKKRKTDTTGQDSIPTLEKVVAAFNQGLPLRALGLTPDELMHVQDCQLITAKPMMFVCNIGEEDLATNGNGWSQAVEAHASKVGARSVCICGKVEMELTELPLAERAEFMTGLGITEPGLSRLIRAGYDLMGLATYFTAGEKEVRAWQIEKGWKAPRAAAVIHTDFEKGFIRAEVASYADYVALKGEKGCKEQGKLRVEGKDYVVKEGDVMHFLFN